MVYSLSTPITLDTPVTDLKFPGRLPRILDSLGIKTIADFLGIDSARVKSLPGIGNCTLQHLIQVQQDIAKHFAGVNILPGNQPKTSVALVDLLESLHSDIARIPALIDQNGDKLSRKDINNLLQLLLERSGLTARGFSPFSIRRATYSRLEENGTDLHELNLQNILDAAHNPWMRSLTLLLLADYALSCSESEALTGKTLRQILSDYAAISVGNEKRWKAWLMRRGIWGDSNESLSLEEVGSRMNLTRERVRQLEKRANEQLRLEHNLRMIYPLKDRLLFVLADSLGVCRVHHMAETLAKQFRWSIYPSELELASLISLFDEGPFLDDGVLRHPDRCIALQKATVKASIQLAEQFPDGRHIADFHHDLSSFLGSQCFDPEQICSLKLFSCGIRQGGDREFPLPYLEATLSDLNPPILKDGRVWPTHISMIRQGRGKKDVICAAMRVLGRPAHFTEIGDLVRRNSQCLAHITDHNVHVGLTLYKEALLWDRGCFIHRDNFSPPISLIQEVELWISRAFEAGAPFVSANGSFLQFETSCRSADITSETALYTALREFGVLKFGYPRCPYIVPTAADERLPVSLALEQYLLDAGGQVSRHELKNYAISQLHLKEYQFEQRLPAILNLVWTGRGKYIHASFLKIDQQAVRNIVNHINTLLSEMGHVSVVRVFEEKLVTCKLAGIDSPQMLHSILRITPHDELELVAYPQIKQRGFAKSKRGRRGIIADIVEYVRSKAAPCSIGELEVQFVDERGYGAQSVYAAVYSNNLFRFGSGAVIHGDTIGWNEEKQLQLENVANEFLSQALRSGRCFALTSQLLEYAALPKLANDCFWTQFLLCEVLSRNGSYRILGTGRDAYVKIPNELGIETFEDLIYEILKSRYAGASNLKEFEEHIRETGIIKKRITPGMLGDQRKVFIRQQLILMRGLADHA